MFSQKKVHFAHSTQTQVLGMTVPFAYKKNGLYLDQNAQQRYITVNYQVSLYRLADKNNS